MKQVIKPRPPELAPVIPIPECEMTKYYGVQFNPETPKLLLATEKSIYGVFRFDNGVILGESSFLTNQQITELNKALNWLLSMHYKVYQFDTFSEWYKWYAAKPASSKPLRVQKPKNEATSTHEKIMISGSGSHSLILRRPKSYSTHDCLYLLKDGTWAGPKPGGDCAEYYYANEKLARKQLNKYFRSDE